MSRLTVTNLEVHALHSESHRLVRGFSPSQHLPILHSRHVLSLHYCMSFSSLISLSISRALQKVQPAPSQSIHHLLSKQKAVNRWGSIHAAEMMGGGAAVGRACKGGPSVMREIIYGMTLGLFAGGLWKIHHWNNQRRTREFYDLLDRGEITVVVQDAAADDHPE